MASPVDVSSRLVSSNATTKVDAPFREAFGALMHLTTTTRSVLVYAVRCVSRFMDNLQEEQWVSARQIFRYLQGPEMHRIRYKSIAKIDFRAYLDAD